MESPPASLSPAAPGPSADQPHLLLEYRSPVDDRVARLPGWWRVGMLVAWCVAAASPFLPVTWGILPWDVVLAFVEEVWAQRFDRSLFLVLLALPFFVAIPAAAWHSRLVAWPRRMPGRGERRAVLALAVLVAVMPPTFIAAALAYQGFSEELTTEEWLFLGSPLAVAGLGVLLAAWLYRRAGRPVEAVATMLSVGYIANATMLLIEFRNDTEIGWLVTLIASALLALSVAVIVLVATRRLRA